MMRNIRAKAYAFIVPILLVGCAAGAATLQQILDMIKAQCGFVTSIVQLATLVATLVSGFNPAAGEGAQVAINVAHEVANAVCKAVVAEVNPPPALGKPKLNLAPGQSQPLTVVVNGVKIDGTYTAPPTK